MSVSLNSSQKIFDFYQDYISPASCDFSTIPKSKAFLQRIFEVFSEVYADPLSSCNLAAECVKGSGGCEAICKGSNPFGVKLHTNQTNDYLTISNPDFNFNVRTPPALWLWSSFLGGVQRIIILYLTNCDWPSLDSMDVFVKESGQTKGVLDKDVLNPNWNSAMEDFLFEDEIINYFKSSLLNCMGKRMRLHEYINAQKKLEFMHKLTEEKQKKLELMRKLTEQKQSYEKMHNITNQEVDTTQAPEKVGSANNPNTFDPQNSNHRSPTAQNVAKSSAPTNQNDATATQTKKEEKQTPPSPQPENTASAQKKEPDANEASAQPKPDQTPEKRDSAVDSANSNQTSSNQSQTNNGSSPNWLLGIGAISGGAGIAGFYAWHQSKKRKLQKEQEAKITGAIKC